MSNLLIFDPADNLLAVLSNEAEEACAFWDAPYKEMLNQGSTFEFMADGIHEDSKYIIAENQVAFMDKDGAFRLFVIKEPERIDGEYGPEIHAICEPAMLELNDEIITDVRPYNTTLRAALTSALNGVRWEVGQTAEDFGLNSTNYYYISVTEAIENIVNTWGGEIRDRVEIQGNRIVGRYIDILTMRGTSTGKRWEMDKDILSIRHQVQSYPKTALYGRGSSLELEDEEGNATGGYSRKISFADVEWKKANGNPVDKPKGQEWVGDPEALNIYGRPNKDGTLRHRFGIFESSEQEDPAQLLLETWNALQEQKHPLDNYEMDVFLMEELTGYEHEKVRLGDITVAIDRSFAKPIEAEERVISFEYDVANPDNSGKVELGQFINLYDAELDNRVDKLERKINDRAGIWDNATKVIDAANGKNKNYYSPIEPVGEFIEGDLWFKVIDGEYTQTYRWNGEQWQLIVDIDVNVAKEEAAEATQRADDAFDKANEATENAQKAIEEAQVAFDNAQTALSSSEASNRIAADAINVANTAKQSAQSAVNKASELESQVIDDIARVNSRADELLAKINDNAANLLAADGKITSIEQNVDTINGSLSLTITTLSDLDDIVSAQQTAITALDEKIELRATKTSVDTLTGRVSNTEGSITTLAGQIELKANADDVYTKTEADGKVTTAINSAKSEIKITTDGISQSVSSLSATVNGIEVGGRNLIANSSANNVVPVIAYNRIQSNSGITKSFIDNYMKLTVDRSSSSDNYYQFGSANAANEHGLVNDSMYTFSIDMYIPSSNSINPRFDFFSNVNNSWVSDAFNFPNIEYDKWKRYYVIGKFRNGSIGKMFRLYLRSTVIGDYLYIKNIKFEKGNKATDYTKAPEDTDLLISEVQSYATSIEQKADSIQSSVSSLSNVVNSQGSRISTAETTINQHTTAINLKAEASNVYTKAQTDSALNNKVNTTTYNNKIGQIDVSISGITNRVSSTESSISSINSNIASLDIKADGIVSSVSQVQTNLDNLEIGGRNLFKDSDFKTLNSSYWKRRGTVYTLSVDNTNTYKGYNSLKIVGSSPGTDAVNDVQMNSIIEAEPLTEYVFSFYAKASVETVLQARWGYATANRVNLTTNWNKYSIIVKSGASIYAGVLSYFDKAGTVWIALPKLELGNKPSDYSPAPEDMATVTQFSTLEQTLNGFTTRVGTAEGNISTLQQTSNIYATRISNAEGDISSISQTLSGVQTTVSNKADKSTVTQLAGVIDSKISTIDANNTFATQSQLTQTASSLTSTISGLLANAVNLIPDGSFENEAWDLPSNCSIVESDLHSGTKCLMVTSGSGYPNPKNLTLKFPVETGTTLKLSWWVKMTSGTTVNAGNFKIRIAKLDGSLIGDLQLGGIFTSWTKRERTMTLPTSVDGITITFPTSVTAGTVYIDDIVVSDATKEIATQSQISQLSDAINLRVTKDDLISQINVDTSGILIQGKKLVLDGNVTVNGTFRVGNANITSVDAGKITTGYLDAARVSASSLSAISANLGNVTAGTISGVTITSTASGDTTRISGGNISSTGTFTRNFDGSNTATYVSTMDSFNGVVRVGITSKRSNGVERVDSSGGRATILTDKAITTQRAIHSAASDKNGARFIDFFANETLTSGVQGLGMHIYSGQDMTIESVSGITLKRSSESDNVLRVEGDLRGRQLFINTIQYNNEFSGANIYVKPPSGYELRVTAANTTESYVDVRARQIFANTLQRNSGASGVNIYIKPASNGEVRATAENTTDTYVPVRASSFPTASLAKYKQDIRPHTDSALDVINSATIYDYRLRSEVEVGKDRTRTGLVIGEGYNTPSCVVDGDGVEQYQMNTLSWLGIQELDKKYRALEVENFALKRRVEELEKAVYAA